MANTAVLEAPADSVTRSRPALWRADGYVIPEGDTGIRSAELLHRARLDYTVKTERFTTEQGADCGRFRAIVRQDTRDVFGVCQSRWRPYDNVKLFEFLDNLVDADEALFIGAWSWHGGVKVGALMQLPEDVEVAGFDRHQALIYAQVSHNAGGSFQVGSFLTRCSCTNMVQGALRGAPYKFRAVHSSSMNVQVAQARSALEVSFKLAKEWDVLASRLLLEPAGEDFARACAAAAWRDKEKRVDLAVAHFLSTPTVPDDIRFTRYGVYAALSEAAEWIIPRTPTFERSFQGAAAVERARILAVCAA